MFGNQDADRKVSASAFFKETDGTGTTVDSVVAAADETLTLRDRVVHVYESNASSQAAYAITLPPVGEAAGLTFAFTTVEDLSTYNVTVQDQDESFDWGDIILTGNNETLVLFSDGRRWHIISRYPNVRTLALESSATVPPGIRVLTLDHTSVTIAAVIADAANHEGLFLVKAITEPGGSGDHTLTLTSGTFNGSNNIATFVDINDALMVYFDSAGVGTVLVNVGAVGLTT